MVQNKKMPLEEFLEIRKEILKHWKTGSHPDLDLDRAVEKLKNLPKEKHFAHKLREAKANGVTLVQPRAGVARINEQPRRGADAAVRARARGRPRPTTSRRATEERNGRARWGINACAVVRRHGIDTLRL